MKHIAQIQKEFAKAALNKQAATFEDLSYEAQVEYLKQHPASKKKLTKQKGEGGAALHELIEEKRQSLSNDASNQKLINAKRRAISKSMPDASKKMLSINGGKNFVIGSEDHALYSTDNFLKLLDDLASVLDYSKEPKLAKDMSHEMFNSPLLHDTKAQGLFEKALTETDDKLKQKYLNEAKVQIKDENLRAGNGDNFMIEPRSIKFMLKTAPDMGEAQDKSQFLQNVKSEKNMSFKDKIMQKIDEYDEMDMYDEIKAFVEDMDENDKNDRRELKKKMQKLVEEQNQYDALIK